MADLADEIVVKRLLPRSCSLLEPLPFFGN